GWVEPKLYSMYVTRDEVLGAANLVQDDQPVLLYNPADLHEFFMLEYRTSAAPGGSGYDANVPSNGLVIWQVKVDDDKEPVLVPSPTGSANMDPAVFILGAPSLIRGHGTAFPPGNFGTGWTHIVSHRGYLFFYNSSYGTAAIGAVSRNGFRQYKSYAAYSVGLGWTHIVSTTNGLVFYSQANGMGAVGNWEFVY